VSLTERQLLCQHSQLSEGTTLELEYRGSTIIVLLHQQQLHAYWNLCPHLSVPLNWAPNRFLDPSKSYLQCATHGALFQLDDGLCVSGPCSDDRLQRVETERVGDDYYISAGQQQPESPRNFRREALEEMEGD